MFWNIANALAEMQKKQVRWTKHSEANIQSCLTPGKTKDDLSDNGSQITDTLTRTTRAGVKNVCCVSAFTACVSICA